MPRNSSGTYSLPAGNPVVTGTTISSTWANTTLSDLGTALTDSLSRSGDGGMTASLELFAGVVGAPGLSWTAETTSGLYRNGAGDFRYSISSTDVLQIVAGAVRFVDGVVGTPAISFLSDTNTGIYRVGVDEMSLVAGGVDRFVVSTVLTSSVAHNFIDGAVGSPAIRFGNDTDTGLYRFGSNNIGVAAGGALIASLSGTSALFTVPVTGADGAVGTPSLSFTNDPNTGLYSIAGDQLGISTGGTLRLTIATGIVVGVATGGDQGAGTINAVGVYDDGVLLANQSGANPTASVGLAAVNGAAATFMRSDAAPALSQSITPTWTAVHTFSARPVFNDGVTINDSARNVASLLDTSQTYGNTTDNPTYTFAGTGVFTTGGVFRGPTGAVGAPTYSFTGDTNTGWYRIAAARVGLAVGGANVLDIDASNVVVAQRIYAPDGTVGSPAYSFSSDTDTGIYRPASNDMRLHAGSTTAGLQITATAVRPFGNIITPDNGSAANPVYTFDSDTNTGIYRSAEDTMVLVTGGTARLTLSTSGIAIAEGAIISGTYTPTITNGANVTGSTVGLCQYMRVGNVVTVSGYMSSVTLTAGGGTATSLEISLPIASNFASTGQCAGLATHNFGAMCGIVADAADNRAQVNWFSNAVSGELQFTFTYLIV